MTPKVTALIQTGVRQAVVKCQAEINLLDSPVCRRELFTNDQTIRVLRGTIHLPPVAGGGNDNKAAGGANENKAAGGANENKAAGGANKNKAAGGANENKAAGGANKNKAEGGGNE
ncbi:hypothetical protein Bpfe_031051 [Biomphalaria pfeifferi]|uniref:Uncharacterized protein n=1 Tax=Biomphalaria pfeifferi TaxID=112525 RepID=A0AAD8ANF5_BIOPF|nr:hypothetical protein Bpfe_031051 [Biomphalaria pfeifferi]